MEDEQAESQTARSDFSPEARRRHALRTGQDLQRRILRKAGPGSRFFAVVQRVVSGTWNDGFIHAGNLAYMTILALFPFLIALAAILSVIGEEGQLDASISTLLAALPPRVADVLDPVARDVAKARTGWLLWAGGAIGLWTAGSLVETIRDILRRAYGTPWTRAFWWYRLGSTGLIFASVLLLLVSLSGQVAIAAVKEIAYALFPRLDRLIDEFFISHLISAAMLYLSIYILFVSLAPTAYQARRYPKWPGALLVTLWWTGVTLALPRVLHNFFTYDLTYGSLAGVMIALFFFWLVGLGMVLGAELNAALAESPEELKLANTASQDGRPRRGE